MNDVRVNRIFSIEEATDGKAARELEYTYYGRLMSTEILDKAFQVEKQEQWSILVDKNDKNKSGGSVRVRKTIIVENGVDSAPTYALTAKSKFGDGDCAEVNCEVSEDMFKVFKAIAESGMIKTRYKFYNNQIASVYARTRFIVEMDVFAGTEWVKIDVEAPKTADGLSVIKPPACDYFEKGILENVITGVKADRSVEDEQKLDELYKNVFTS